MLLVKTHIKNSPIHGIGLFAAEFIPKGDLIWKYEEGFDLCISDEKKLSLPKLAQDFIEFFYYYKEGFGWTILADNSRFINHSEVPNTDSQEFFTTIANKDIQIGEEIFENYYHFNDKSEEFMKKYVNCLSVPQPLKPLSDEEIEKILDSANITYEYDSTGIANVFIDKEDVLEVIRQIKDSFLSVDNTVSETDDYIAFADFVMRNITYNQVGFTYKGTYYKDKSEMRKLFLKQLKK